MNRSLLCFFSILSVLFFGLQARAQEVPMLHFTQDDGLPANTIYFLYRDSNDFLWITTDKGIARYNGIKFEKFSTFDGMPDNEIFFVKEDYDGRLWLATFNGELCFYKNGIFHTAANTPFLKMPFKTAFIKDISVQYDSSVNVIFADASVLLNIKNDQCTIIKLKDVLGDERQGRVIFNEKIAANRYRLVTSDAVLIVDNSNNTTRVVKMESNSRKGEKCSGKWEPSFCQNQSHLYNKCGIYNKDLKEVATIPTELIKDDFIYSIYFNDKGKFLTTSKGLLYNDELALLRTERISSITQDKSGNYWLGTLDNGIYSINSSFLTSSVINKAYKGKVRYANVIKGHLFFVDEGNNVLSLQGDKVIGQLDQHSYLKEKGGNSYAFFIDSNYNFYYCSNSNCAIVDNLQRPSAISQYHIDLKGPNSLKKAVSFNDNIFLHASFRIVKIDVNNQQTYKVLNDTTRSERIYGMAQDADNNVWYTTVNNVYKAVGDGSDVQSQFSITFKTFDFFGKDLIGYTHDNQLVICSDINKKVQIDSVTGQNCIWDKLYKIDSTHILLSTNNLYRVLTLSPGKNPRFSISTIENPFIPTQAETICIDTNKSYFFKNGKITVIDIKTLLASPVPPKPYFTFLKTRKATYPITPNMQISFRESRNMKISFITSSFSGKELAYQYSLSRTDAADNWVDVMGDEINIVNSGYGNYVIKVRAKTISSEYSAPVVFKLEVTRPYWATWWFFLMCACALSIIIFMVVRRRVQATLNKKQREHENQVRFMKSEYKALNALMNPHFIFNTLNNVQGLVNRNDKLAANEYLRVFADLVRQNMHNVSKELIPLQKEVDLVANYLKLEKLRFKEMLNYSINIEDDLDLSDIMIPPLLIQPLVENSIKHGILPLESVEGRIELDIYRRDGVLFLEVKDNGIGIVESQKKPRTSHESFGLENIKKRIEQLGIIQNKDIRFDIAEVHNDEGGREWTIATITMPIEDEATV